MQRYNQGFFKFGPLEKSNTGNLILFSDHEKEVGYLLQTFAKYKEINDLNAKKRDETLSWMSNQIKYYREANITLEKLLDSTWANLQTHYIKRLLALLFVYTIFILFIEFLSHKIF